MSLGVIILALTISIIASLRHPLPAGNDHDEDVLERTPAGAIDRDDTRTIDADETTSLDRNDLPGRPEHTDQADLAAVPDRK